MSPTPQENLEKAQIAVEHGRKRLAFSRAEKDEVSKKTPEELALWQWEHGSGSPQYILAEYEWKLHHYRVALNVPVT